MKMSNQFKVCLLTACLSLPTALLAADGTYNSGSSGTGNAAAMDNDMNQGRAGRNGNYRNYDKNNPENNNYNTRNLTTTGTPQSCNKASSLIGMEVRNNNGDKLGDVKDIVLDFQSGKISYVVLDSGTIFNSKLFAVPLSAFNPSPTKDYLVLNADKSKIENAQGFDKNSWPSVSNPDWGASTFWQPNQNGQNDSSGYQNSSTNSIQSTMPMP